MERIRIDRYLVERGLAPSRERAQALILAGGVRVNGKVVDKAGSLVPADAAIAVAAADHPYVGRGGVKLAHALDHFRVDVTDRIALDAGASTGGFTDCLLQRGAARVYAVDVGRGQLAWSLRQDPRVVIMDRTNLRLVHAAALPEAMDLVTLDLAFISVTKVFAAVDAVLKTGGAAIILIKPQFEVGKDKVGKGGIVRDPALRDAAVAAVHAAAAAVGWQWVGVTPSPITGADGNQEFLAYCRKS
ncbi:MAG: TlyA family RNA methyltransferase [Deltaproteobacteria bacterium]|nr:TlyA family RNA methyltransferase [Deltaproteobacteria bacterium]